MSKQKIFILIGLAAVALFVLMVLALHSPPGGSDQPELRALPTPEPITDEQRLEAQKKEFIERWQDLVGKLEIEKKFAAFKRRHKIKSEMRNMESYVEIDLDREAALMEHLLHGKLPIFIEGDFDCDGKVDQVFLLDDSSFVVGFAGGKTAAVTDAGWDSIALGNEGGGDSYDGPFQAKCDYIIGIKFESAARAYVYDAEIEKFAEYQTSD